MQHNCRCYSILFFILSLVLFISPSPLSLHYPSTPLTIVSFVCVYVWVGWRDGSLLWLLLFGRYLAKVLSLFSSLTLDSKFLLFPCTVSFPFPFFSVHFETAILWGRRYPKPRKGFRIYDYFISGPLIIPPTAVSKNGPAGEGEHLILYGCLIKSRLLLSPFHRSFFGSAPRLVLMWTFEAVVGAE